MPDEADLAQEHIEQEAAMRERERIWYATHLARTASRRVSVDGCDDCGETVEPQRRALDLHTCFECASAAERKSQLLSRRFR